MKSIFLCRDPCLVVFLCLISMIWKNHLVSIIDIITKTYLQQILVHPYVYMLDFSSFLVWWYWTTLLSTYLLFKTMLSYRYLTRNNFYLFRYQVCSFTTAEHIEIDTFCKKEYNNWRAHIRVQYSLDAKKSSIWLVYTKKSTIDCLPIWEEVTIRRPSWQNAFGVLAFVLSNILDLLSRRFA